VGVDTMIKQMKFEFSDGSSEFIKMANSKDT
jgi:hypothetical protein